MEFRTDYDLSNFNTFKIAARAHTFCGVGSLTDLDAALSYANTEDLPILVLGAGSNVLFAGNYPGLVVHIRLPGMQLEPIDRHRSKVTVGAGENWHSFVINCINKQLYGVENLALIPGTIGAAPIQNIGAYGVELADSLVSLEAIDIATGKALVMSREDCQFAYRDSIFKRSLWGKVIITAMSLELTNEAEVKTAYGALSDELKLRGQLGSATPQLVAEAVMAIRRRKLPDPQTLPNAGSFFKNPLIPLKTYEQLQGQYGEVPGFRQPGEPAQLKVPAAWLLDKAGWQGRRQGAVGVHEHQAVVVVNYAGASGAEVLQLTRAMQDSIAEKFAIHLEPEVRIINSQAS